MAVVRLSPRAQTDAARITLDIKANRGDKQARAWRAQFADCLRRIGENPRIYQERPDVLPGIRAGRAGQYHLWYLANDTGVRVQRVLPQSRDVTESLLKPPH